MTELFRVVEPARPCSYLPRQTASLELRAMNNISALEYAGLLARGWRRFGWQFFRPACPRCTECQSVRVLAAQFQATAGQRRVMRKNEQVHAELHPLFAVRETVDLYHRYQRFMHEHRGWDLQEVSAAGYHDMFLAGPSHLGRQWLYFDGDRLVGVYFFHDPAWRPYSPGVFSIITQVEYARSKGLPYVYLGYWIKDCGSMNYKDRFRPYEMLDRYVTEEESPLWRRI